MKNKTLAKKKINHRGLINPEILWSIENELIDIPLQFRDRFWNEILDSYMQDSVYAE